MGYVSVSISIHQHLILNKTIKNNAHDLIKFNFCK